MDAKKYTAIDEQKMAEAAKKILAKPLSHMEFYVQMFLEGYADKPQIAELVSDWLEQSKVVMDENRRIKLNGTSLR